MRVSSGLERCGAEKEDMRECAPRAVEGSRPLLPNSCLPSRPGEPAPLRAQFLVIGGRSVCDLTRAGYPVGGGEMGCCRMT